jgi:hypothetical protein
MPKSVKCKNCNNLVNHWCEKVIDSPDPELLRDCQHFWERTNGDRIRSMTDEELVDLLVNGRHTFRCYNCAPFECDDNCEKHCMEWLKEPVEVDNG